MAFDKTGRMSLRWFVLLQLSLSWTTALAQSSSSSSETPYIIFADGPKIMKMNTDGSNLEELGSTGGFTIVAMDYHHRLNTIFWISESFFSFAFLQKLELNKTPLQIETLRSFTKNNAGGLAVDWINDKIYWTERRKILELDLPSNDTVPTTIATLTGDPAGIGIFPYRNSSVLYFIEKERNVDETSPVSALVRMPVRGGTQTILSEGDRETPCLHALTIDYSNVEIYWNIGCQKEINAIKYDGTGYRLVYDGNDMVPSHMSASQGIAYYDSAVYWTDSARVFKFNSSVDAGIPERLYKHGQLTTGIKVVHSSLQPSEEQLRRFEACSGVRCVNGECLGEGRLCECHPGWTGDACDQDIDECKVNNGGCQQLCTNKIGSHECSCQTGYALGSNKRNCIDLTTTEPPQQATTTSEVPTTDQAVSTDPTPSTADPKAKTTTDAASKPATDNIPGPTTERITKPEHVPGPTTESKDKPITDQAPKSTTEGETKPVTDPVSRPATTESTVTAQPITSQQTSTSHYHLTTTASSEQPTASPDTMPVETLKDHTSQPTQDNVDSTSNSSANLTSSTIIDSSATPQVAIPTDGIKAILPKEGSSNLVIIIATSATGTVVLGAIVCYLVFLYCKYSRNKRGSYDVQRRHRAGDVESATSSARNSFRAVSEYHYSPNLDSHFLQQILNPGSVTSVSERSTTSTVPHGESCRNLSTSESETGAVTSASDSSTESESRPLRVT